MSNYLKVGEALKYLESKGFSITNITLKKWLKEYELGKKIGSFWYTSEEQLDKILNGEIEFKDNYRSSK